MTAHDDETTTAAPRTTLHWLPCSVAPAGEGPAPVSAYFQPAADGKVFKSTRRSFSISLDSSLISRLSLLHH